MLRSRTSTTWLVVWGGLVFLSLRPLAPVERALDLVLAPLRFVAALGAPLELLRLRSASAAERTLARAAASEAAEGAAALARLAERALPADPALRAGRRFVPGEVTARPGKDRCWVQVRERRGIEPLTPVVCGDAFVGRVVEVRPELDGPGAQVLVEVVTAAGFRVGAEVEGEEPVFLTAGGLELPRRGRGEPKSVRLAVHQPSSSALAGGLARVHELFADEGEQAELAQGFRLGSVRRDGERESWWIEPELDYLDGLFQVALVTRADPASGPAPAATPVLDDGRWLAARPLTPGDPAPWRSTLKIALGRRDGVRTGSAVTGVGARLIGRVSRAGLTSSDVSLLADPGFTLVAVACLEGEAEPRILGRLTTLGRTEEGAIRMRWWVRVPADARGERSSHDPAPPARARIYSGSGDQGLPGGLFLGSALLPQAAAGQVVEILLQPDVDPADVRRLFVREAGPDPGRSRP